MQQLYRSKCPVERSYQFHQSCCLDFSPSFPIPTCSLQKKMQLLSIKQNGLSRVQTLNIVNNNWGASSSSILMGWYSHSLSDCSHFLSSCPLFYPNPFLVEMYGNEQSMTTTTTTTAATIKGSFGLTHLLKIGESFGQLMQITPYQWHLDPATQWSASSYCVPFWRKGNQQI